MSTVLVPIARGFEELEAVTIVDILRRGGVEVTTAGLEPGPVRASRGIVMVPDTSLDAVLEADFDMIVLPGGSEGSERLREDRRVLDLLRRHHGAGHTVAAICAAPRVLAEAGLLEGRRATGYPGILDDLVVPGLRRVHDAVVTEGTVVTSRGPGTAIDFALELLGILAGPAVRDDVERQLVREG